MAEITPEMARAELARRELARRQQNQSQQLNEIPQPESWYQKLPRNIVAGLAQLGHRTMNLPHDVTETLETRLQEIGNAMPQLNIPGMEQPQQQEFTHPLSSKIPYQSEKDFAGMLGQQGQGTLLDRLIQGGISYTPEILSGRALLRAGMRKYPLTQKMASRQLREAEKIARDIPVPLSADALEQARPFLPKTFATDEMLQGAGEGGYRESFATQSQIGKHARDLQKSPLASERLLAPEVQELKQNMLKEMTQQLRVQGYEDAAKLLEGGIKDYKTYIKIRDNVYPLLKKIGIPTTALAAMDLIYNKFKKLAKEDG